MQQRAFIIAAGCLCLVPVHTVRADAKADARQGIQAAYNRYADAIARGDVDTIMSVKAPGYTDINQDGQVRQRSEDELRQHYVEFTKRPNKVLNKFRILSLDLHGNEATVTDEERVEGVRLDKGTGQLVPIHVVESDRDFWVKTGGRWQWKRSRTLSVSGA